MPGRLKEILPWIFSWRAYYATCQKKTFRKKIRLSGLNFRCRYWPVLAKQPTNCQFCDIIVLLNHLTNVTRNQDMFVGCSEIRSESVIVKHVQHGEIIRAFCLPRVPGSTEK